MLISREAKVIHCLDKTADENLPTGVFESPEAADLSQPGSREVSQGDSISYGGCSVPMKTGSYVSSAGKGLWLYTINATRSLLGMGSIPFAVRIRWIQVEGKDFWEVLPLPCS